MGTGDGSGTCIRGGLLAAEGRRTTTPGTRLLGPLVPVVPNPCRHPPPAPGGPRVYGDGVYSPSIARRRAAPTASRGDFGGRRGDHQNARQARSHAATPYPARLAAFGDDAHSLLEPT
jgi:hypothetical protein